MKPFNKKGSFFDIMYIGIFLFIMAITITVGWVISSKINDEWQTKTELGSDSQEIMQDYSTRYVALWDNVFLILMVGLYLAALILAFMVDINPVFFFLSLFIMAIIVVIMAVLGNSWYNYATNSEMASYIDDFVIIPYVLGHYVQVLVVMAFGLAGVMYAKTQ